MKKIAVLLLVLISLAPAKILVQGVDLAESDVHYISLEVKYNFKFKNYFAYVDYGQKAKFRDKIVVSENGDNREFNSTIDVLNIFYKNGWEIKTAITKTSGGANESDVSSDTYYILEKRDEK